MHRLHVPSNFFTTSSMSGHLCTGDGCTHGLQRDPEDHGSLCSGAHYCLAGCRGSSIEGCSCQWQDCDVGSGCSQRGFP
ncbi:hypothetical protein DUNSADRAFT_1830 [Dunaliella salina]|uniref:Uncharacterized protein n=1 Tax=Dunaliella salina TaxID=3046 RepID=A0ABQ7FWY8_DUNSA|nr:hypothetical protein DUNSADRAFT_1830 [Dunaliella salina]|eukprot:KAF5826875.1 hypothetical protein DUNSADRAFT_1830 [Dunaliella salina]